MITEILISLAKSLKDFILWTKGRSDGLTYQKLKKRRFNVAPINVGSL